MQLLCAHGGRSATCIVARLSAPPAAAPAHTHMQTKPTTLSAGCRRGQGALRSLTDRPTDDGPAALLLRLPSSSLADGEAAAEADPVQCPRRQASGAKLDFECTHVPV